MEFSSSAEQREERHERQNQLILDLVTKGRSVLPGFFSANLCQDLQAELKGFYAEKFFKAAKIGRGQGALEHTETRSDFIMWIDQMALTKSQTVFWDEMKELQLKMNRELFLGLQELECHLSIYPQGAFYKKHLDQFQKDMSRVVSFVLYLNFSWKQSDGGQLKIFAKDDPLKVELEVFPQAGTLVCFLSSCIYHEVMVTSRERYSLTGWMRKTNNFLS